jgi:YidC/Oxa1 family membrane protein insertase
MDFQRILIMLGLAVTTYMLILAWNEDYGSGRVDNDSVIVANVPQDNLLPDINVNTVSTTSTTADNGQIDFLPLDNGLSAPVTETAVNDVALNTQNSRYVTIASDVLNITIDTLGGDIVEASLIKFPVAINQPDSPFVLMDPRNAYAAQSGLI